MAAQSISNTNVTSVIGNQTSSPEVVKVYYDLLNNRVLEVYISSGLDTTELLELTIDNATSQSTWAWSVPARGCYSSFVNVRRPSVNEWAWLEFAHYIGLQTVSGALCQVFSWTSSSFSQTLWVQSGTNVPVQMTTVTATDSTVTTWITYEAQAPAPAMFVPPGNCTLTVL